MNSGINDSNYDLIRSLSAFSSSDSSRSLVDSSTAMFGLVLKTIFSLTIPRTLHTEDRSSSQPIKLSTFSDG